MTLLGSSPSAAGVVLAGGRSSRMGTDKSMLVVDGVRMVDRALRALRAAGVGPRYVSGHPGDDFAADVVVVPDLVGAAGPLDGIVSTWTHISGERAAGVDRLVVLSCDLPQITPALVVELLTAADLHAHGAVAHDGERPQPLVAVYRASALDHMTQACAAGERSVRRLFGDWDLGQVAAHGQAVDADEPVDLVAHDVAWPTGHQVGEAK